VVILHASTALRRDTRVLVFLANLAMEGGQMRSSCQDRPQPLVFSFSSGFV
jgi:hypothetical protein